MLLSLPRSLLRPSDAALLPAIHDAADRLRPACDEALRGEADRLRSAVRGGRDCTHPAVLVPAFALTQEAVRRTLGATLFDVQLLAGLVLARGAIAEMATGEGKTLAATLPAFVRSLGGEGVHVATPNAYLAQRDAALVTPVFRLLGTSVGLVPEGAAIDAKRTAYACDVTYATGYELGFDYLRDRLAALRAGRPGLGHGPRGRLSGQPAASPTAMQRRHAAAIIDEIDSVLIDEACLPLVLSDGPGDRSRLAATYAEARRLGDSLAAGDDYLIEAAERRVTLTSQGLQKVYADYAGRLRLELQRPWAVYVQQALSAALLYRHDVDYVVREGKVLLVDEFTGRIFADRSWRDGLQQAVEAKEGLLPSGELQTAARISRQRYFRLYRTICGMTGTATGSEREFRRLYRLPSVQVPLRKPCRRELLPTRYFVDAASKWQAIVEEVAGMYRLGRPVLIGSRTIENSELLAARLAAVGIPYQLLNGKQDQAEAAIIAAAGQPGMVTIATNMAGRGTDICLGPGVADRGGLHVIGAECHESRRIDRQLLGRAGRQGDPGTGRFFIAADDALLDRFGPRLQRRLRRLPHTAGEIHRDLTAQIALVQRRAERAARLQRRRMLGLDDWIDEMLVALM